MGKIQKTYETRLETANIENIPAILDAKLAATSPESVVDYIAFALDNIDAQIEKIKDAQAKLTRLKKDAEHQAETIKIGGAKWLEDAGVDKLKGLVTSSITILHPTPKKDVVIDNKEALINAGYFKTDVDKTAVKKAIMEGEEIEGAHLEIVHSENMLKVNKGAA